MAERKTRDQTELPFTGCNHDMHLVYDDQMKFDNCVVRYRIWFGIGRVTICVITPVSGYHPSRKSGVIATRLFREYISRVKQDISAAFIYVEVTPGKHGEPVFRRVEFEKVIDMGEIRFWNGNYRLISPFLLESLIDNPKDVDYLGSL